MNLEDVEIGCRYTLGRQSRIWLTKLRKMTLNFIENSRRSDLHLSRAPSETHDRT